MAGKRIFNIMQYEKNPITGEDLHFNEEVIKEALTHKTIKEWAYILHDNDRYTEEDEANDLTGGRKAGELKPRHWHIVINCPIKAEISTIAKWFNVPENFVDVPKGWGAFLDCVEYLTHKTEKCEKLGKTPYEDEEVRSNFNFRERLDERIDKRLKYGRDLDPKRQMRYDVLYLGKTLKECAAEDPILYMEDIDRLKKLRLEYISTQKIPDTRINYYISGLSGYGKDVASRALARSLYPGVDDDELFFEVGAKNVSFEGYDGQPVIIWSEYRAKTLLDVFDGRENLFKVFDTHPHDVKVNIKFNSVKLTNTINIVNSVQDYYEFLDGLAGEYIDKKGNRFTVEDKGQSYRRFPFIMPLHTYDLDILLSKYFTGESNNPTEYEQWKKVVGSFRKVRIMCKNNEELAQEYERKMLAGVPEKTRELLANEQTMTEEEIRKELEHFGEEITIAEPNTEDEQQKEEIDFTDFDKISKNDFFG